MQRMHNLPAQCDHRRGLIGMTGQDKPLETSRWPDLGAMRSSPADGDGPAWQPTHRHRKGGLYRLLDYGTNEADRTPVVIYDDSDGTLWVRSVAEFNDGRFVALSAYGSDQID
jgi:hypothetical protein